MPVSGGVASNRMRDGRPSALPSAVMLVSTLAFLSAVGCDSIRRCSNNTECPTGYGCQMNQCIPIVSGRTLAVEILPPSDSMAARTERPNVTFAGMSVPIYLDATAVVAGTVEAPVPATVYSSDAHVQVTIPSRLPGRVAQQLGTEMAMNQFMFGVGSSRLDTVTATFLFTPGTTNSQSQPPIPLSAKLEPLLDFTFPTNDQMTVIHGQLVDDQNKPLADYVARAMYQGSQGQQVSNIFPTLSDGTFALMIPPDAVPTANDVVTLILTPPAKILPPTTNGQTAQSVVDLPQFVSGPLSLKTLAAQTVPPVFVLPAFIPATTVSFSVVADGQPQSGVSVRFTMDLPLPAGGSAYFQSTATSDSSGIVTAALVPGTVNSPVSYQAMIQGRDSTFMYASQCIPALPVNVDAAGNLPASVPFRLNKKVRLSGTVSDSMSAPAVSAQVLATQIIGQTDCGTDATPPPVVSSNTGSGGEYALLLDPGTYRIEVDAPPSSMVNYPRTILDGADAVPVTATLVHNISLPAGNVAMGIVYAPDGVTPVPMASVEIFEVFCKEAPCGAVQPPVSLALVTTDATGSFQTVLPALP